MLWGWAYPEVEHCSERWRHCMQPFEYFGLGWAQQGYSEVGAAGIICGQRWALLGYSVDILRLGTAGILCCWACQGYSALEYSAFGDCTEGDENIDVRVGNSGNVPRPRSLAKLLHARSNVQ